MCHIFIFVVFLNNTELTIHPNVNYVFFASMAFTVLLSICIYLYNQTNNQFLLYCNTQGWTPDSIAEQCGHTEMVAILKPPPSKVHTYMHANKSFLLVIFISYFPLPPLSFPPTQTNKHPHTPTPTCIYIYTHSLTHSHCINLLL